MGPTPYQRRAATLAPSQRCGAGRDWRRRDGRLAGKHHWDPEPWAQYWKKRLRLDGQVQIHLRRVRSGPAAPHFRDVTRFWHTLQICQEIARFKAAAFIGKL